MRESLGGRLLPQITRSSFCSGWGANSGVESDWSYSLRLGIMVSDALFTLALEKAKAGKVQASLGDVLWTLEVVYMAFS